MSKWTVDRDQRLFMLVADHFKINVATAAQLAIAYKTKYGMSSLSIPTCGFFADDQ